MKKFISALLTLCLVLSSVSIVGAADVWTKASDWAVNDLNVASSEGLFPDSLKNVDLTQNITRAEQAALSVKIYEVLTGNKSTAAENPFTDTNDGEVLKALSLGITSGTSATTFEPNANLTREQAASMLARVYKKINISGWTLEKDSEFNFEFTMPSKFADDTKISSWANQSVYFMASKKWILGKDNNNFAPLDSCTREQALIIAKRIVGELKGSTPAQKEKFTVTCIGGSLTEGGAVWISSLKKYLQEKMPDKEVVTVNSGIGGTTSEYGAKRFQRNVLDYNPDLVIIEFSVNDYHLSEQNMQLYMESMVRQCINADKVPAVMFLHSPNPYCDEVNTANNKFGGTVKSINAKNTLANHYDIPVVNGMEYINNLYDETNKGETYFDWLAQYYNKSGDSYDVHPKSSGYKLFSDAIIAAFEEDGLDSFLRPVSDNSIFNSSAADTVNATYKHRFVTDSDITFSSEWTKLTKDTRDTIPAKHFGEPYFTQGVATTVFKGATVTFKTTAQTIYINHISSTEGGEAVITVDGKEIGTTSTYSSFNNMNYVSNAISLGGSGEKTVTLTTKELGKPFTFGSIIEEYK